MMRLRRMVDDNTPADIIAELAFMQYLRGNRYSCVQPVPSLRGHLVETLDTQTGTHHAVMFNGTPGTNRLEIGDPAPAQFVLWGEVMGEMHRLAQSCEPGQFIRYSWKEQLGLVENVLAQAHGYAALGATPYAAVTLRQKGHTQGASHKCGLSRALCDRMEYRMVSSPS